MKKVLFLFGVLEHQDIEWLIEEGIYLQVEAKHQLIEQGKEQSNVYIVLDGEFAISFEGEKPFAQIGQGEVLGEISFIDRMAPSANVIANTAAEVLCINWRTLQEKLNKDKAFAARFNYSLALLLSHRLRNISSGEQEAENQLGEFLMDNLHQAGSSFRQVVEEVRMKE